MIKTVEEIMAANAARGDLWFAPDTMAFWDTYVSPWTLPDAFGGAYFITRETDPSSDASMWTVRYAMASGEVISVGDFMAHASAEEAKVAARAEWNDAHAPEG